MYVAEVKEKGKAKEVYDRAISMRKTAGLVKYAGVKNADDGEVVAEASLKRDLSVLAGSLEGTWRSSRSPSTLRLTAPWPLS